MPAALLAATCLLFLASPGGAQDYSIAASPPPPSVVVKASAMVPAASTFPIAASISYSIDGAGLAHVQFQARNMLPPSQASDVAEALRLTMSGLLGTAMPPSVSQTYPLIRPAQNSLFRGSATIVIPLTETPSGYPASWSLTQDANGSYLNIPLSLDGQQNETDTFTLAYQPASVSAVPAAASPAAMVGSQPQAK